MKIQRAVALRVSGLLIKHNITQYELSKRMLTDRSTVKHIMHEEYKSIKFDTMVKIADAFGMTVQEFLNDDYNLDSVYRQYNTTALILSNYDASFDDTKYLSPDLLLTYILNNTDLNLSQYYKWLYSTKDVLPSSNFVVSQDKNGEIYYTLALPNEMKNMYNTRKKMQYMLFK